MLAKIKKRVDWVDYAKGLSIILVVATHSMFSSDTSLHHDAIEFLNSIVVRIRMPLFFFVSALFIHKAMTSDKIMFYKFKVSHLFYLFILWSIIRYFTMTVPEHFLLGGTDGGLTNIFTILYSPPSTLWFIYALMIYMILTRFTKHSPYIFLLIAMMLNLSADILSIDGFLRNIISYYPFFLSGYIFSKFALRKANDFKYYSLLFPAIYFVIVTISMNYDWSQERYGILLLSFGGVIAGCIIAVALTRLKAFSWLGYVGRNTLPIYLMHYLPLGILKIILPVVIPYQSILAFIIMVSSGVVLPLLVKIVAEKLNMYWLFQTPFINRTNKRRNTTTHIQ